MSAARSESPIRLSCLLMLGSALFCLHPPAFSQTGMPSDPVLVQVNITTVTQGAPSVVEIAGKIIRDYRPNIVELYPSTGIVTDFQVDPSYTTNPPLTQALDLT